MTAATTVEREPLSAAEFLAEFDPWSPDRELHPWVTFKMALRLDALDRREAALRAIEDWPDGWHLRLAVFEEWLRLDNDHAVFDADLGRAEASWVAEGAP